MKKFIFSLIILLIFGASIFFIGWIQIYIPVDSSAVLVSKTSGVKDEVIQAGTFTWCWERLLPTNTQIRSFSLYPQKYTKTIAGSLPSADIYKYMIEGEPNFSYNFSIDITLNAKSKNLPTLVKSIGLTDQKGLDAYLDIQADTIAQAVITYILETSVNNSSYVVQASLSDSELIDGINASTKFPNLEISAIKVKNITLPDITMYKHAKESYSVYHKTIQTYIDEAAITQASQATKDYLEIERLTRLGSLLKEYPELLNYIAVTEGNTNYKLSTDLTSFSEITE